MNDETTRPKLVFIPADREEPATRQVEPGNPFVNLDALRNPQDYEEFLGGEAVSAFAVRTLKEGLYLRVNPDQNYSLFNQYTVATRTGTYFVYPQFREARDVAISISRSTDTANTSCCGKAA